MEKKSRRKFSAEFKTKVVLEALKEKYTIEEIARKHELHPNQITIWKKEFLSKASTVFESERVPMLKKERDEDLETAYAEIGRLKIERDFLKKKLD
jgi:transposase-like protein